MMMKICRACILCAVLSLLVVAQASAQSIVGAWVGDDAETRNEGAFVLVFLANGYYFQIENAQASAAPNGFDGFERGTYTWNPVTGALTVTTIQDLNGDIGLSGYRVSTVFPALRLPSRATPPPPTSLDPMVAPSLLLA